MDRNSRDGCSGDLRTRAAGSLPGLPGGSRNRLGYCKDLSRIFDPLFSDRDAGRGLDLSVVLGIVRAHDGAVSVWSELGIIPCNNRRECR